MNTKTKKVVKPFRAHRDEDQQRHAHCSFCGGKGADMSFENVTSPLGAKYRVPKSHQSCKETILSLSLSLFNLENDIE